MQNRSFHFLLILVFVVFQSCSPKSYNFGSFLPQSIDQGIEDTDASLSKKQSNDHVASYPGPVLIAEKSNNVMIHNATKKVAPYKFQSSNSKNTGKVISAIIIPSSLDKRIIPEKPVNKFTILLLAALFPPLAVGIQKKFASWQFFLCMGLTLSFFLPGLVYAVIVSIRGRKNF